MIRKSKTSKKEKNRYRSKARTILLKNVQTERSLNTSKEKLFTVLYDPLLMPIWL